MMFVYHYVIIPFHPQYLPRHAPQGGGCQGGGCRESKRLSFLYYYLFSWFLKECDLDKEKVMRSTVSNSNLYLKLYRLCTTKVIILHRFKNS